MNVFDGCRGFNPLPRGGEEQIHHESLRLLAEKGVRVESPLCRQVLREIGVEVGEDRVVRLPREMVLSAVETAPKEVVLAGRDNTVLSLRPGSHYHISGAYMPGILDLKGGEPRRATLSDAADCARLADALAGIDCVCPQVFPTDLPASLQELRLLEALALNTSKHCILAPLSRQGHEFAAGLAQVLTQFHPGLPGPLMSVAVSTTSPLVLDADSGDGLLQDVRAGLSLITLPCPMAGGTSPFTLAGTLVILNAESLFLLALAQAVKAGAPVIYGAVGAVVDMRTGRLSMGSPELSLFSAATARMAAYYGLPSYVAMQCNSSRPDPQAAVEKATSLLIAMASGANLTIGAGSLDNCMLACHEQMVLDAAMVRGAERVFRGIQVDEDALAIETILEVGQGGSFLVTDHTLRHLRTGEHFYDEILSPPGASRLGSDVWERAHAEAERLLADHRSSVPDQVREAVKEFVRASETGIRDA